jgi:type IV secretory pathway VirB2 component (pilin)
MPSALTVALTFVEQNPQAIKAYLVAVLALVSKFIFAITGVTVGLGPWDDVLRQFIDVICGAMTFYGVVIGIIHTSRGPSIPPNQLAATPQTKP